MNIFDKTYRHIVPIQQIAVFAFNIGEKLSLLRWAVYPATAPSTHMHMHTHLSTLLVHPPKLIGPSPGTVAPAGVMLAAVLM